MPMISKSFCMYGAQYHPEPMAEPKKKKIKGS